MSDHKFCFIICTNNEIALNECLHYIDHLLIPEGYDVDTIVIEEAKSMTAGYNEALKQSDAKYKIYMHQDVFIINKNFLQNIVDIFGADEKIGMIGMVGYERIARSGMMWHENDIGSIYRPQNKKYYSDYKTYEYLLSVDSYMQVAVIDGFMMITSKDLEWNAEDIDGWDFYDAYQSVNFLEHGYKIVVPYQRYPWCIHDDGVVLNLVNYNNYRKKFEKRYPDLLGKDYEQIERMILEKG